MKTKIFLSLILITNIFFAQNNEMLEDLAINKFEKNFSSYNQLTAIYCSQVSEIAYWKSEDIKNIENQLNNKYPNDNYHLQLIDHKDKKSHTQALLYGNKFFLIVAFRGTEPSRIRDWITDAKFWNYENNYTTIEQLANMPAGHGGFRKSLISLITEKKMFDKIDKIISKLKPDFEKSKFPIYSTGHSLGAAISQLFIEPLNYKGYNFSGAYHFAPPLAVSCKLNDYMKTNYGDKVYDIVNYKDYVPRAGRNGVAHFGKFYRICKNGLIYSEKESYTKFRFYEYLSEFKLHSLANHHKAIRSSENSLAEITKRSVGDYPCIEPKNKIKNCN
jgi:hypothetical protein